MKENLTWHNISIKNTLDRLSTRSEGLTQIEAIARQKEFGQNTLPEKKPLSPLQIFFRQFLNPLIYVLILAGIIAMAVGEIKDSVFIFIVIAINAILGTFQEWKAEKSTEALKSYLKSIIKVRRDSEVKNLDSSELVPGDIVLLEPGIKIPADLRIIETNNLTVDESILTGESVPVHKQEGMIKASVMLPERSNMLFAGTSIVSGRAEAVAVTTGIRTELGKIAFSVNETKSEKPPLIVRMERFSKKISLVILIIVGILAIHAFIQGLPFQEVLIFAISLSVAAIPESLPIAFTVVLSIATKRMAKKNVIVRRLAAVESLGSCTIIASDKTGTLTENKQTVERIVLPNSQEIESKSIPDLSEKDKDCYDIIIAGTLCNESEMSTHQGQLQVHGDSVDVAFIHLANKANIKFDKLKKQYTFVTSIPYESEKKYAAKFFKRDGSYKVFVKGAAEVIFEFCNDKNAEQYLAKVEKMSKNGYRVIALASGKVSIEEDRIKDIHYLEKNLNGLEFLGLIGLIDPLRPEVKKSVQSCLGAGIKVLMITGDHPATAFAIGKDLGIVDDFEQVVTGSQLEKLGDSSVPKFMDKVKNARIFARVTPAQKLQIVECLTASGEFVAVTGDGVNDAPAIKKANIGLAMGTGTDTTKEAASLVILDDNFSSIEKGIEEGRFAYDNIRKITYLVLSTSVAEILLFILAFISQMPMPLLPVQLLWLNLVTNGIRDIGLAFEAGEKETMNKPPRNPKEDIVNKSMLYQVSISGICIALISFFVWEWLLNGGYGIADARNILVLLLVILLNIHTFNCRSESKSIWNIPISKNWYLLGSIVAAQLFHMIAMYFEPLGNVLKLGPVSGSMWLLTIGLGLTILFLMEGYKLMQRSAQRRESY